jgi:membrane protein YdbS with pleckstrin-like domain
MSEEASSLESTAPIPAAPAASRPGETSGFEALTANARWGFRLEQLLTALMLWLPVLLVARPLLARSSGAPIAWTMTLLLLGLLLAWAWRLAERRFRALRFRLDGDGLSIRRGVYWQSETHVPRSRVQHTDIQRGPLDRRLGLAELLIHTAGTQMATVRLPGLTADRASALRDALLEGHDQRF